MENFRYTDDWRNEAWSAKCKWCWASKEAKERLPKAVSRDKKRRVEVKDWDEPSVATSEESSSTDAYLEELAQFHEEIKQERLSEKASDSAGRTRDEDLLLAGED